MDEFQSTRPRGARPKEKNYFADPEFMFQSTRPRVARLMQILKSARSFIVSIHAPAWGATGDLIVGTTCGESFNPRARVGRDS